MLNSLANQYGLAASHFANRHPSIPNYFELTTGQTLTLIDALTPHSFPVSENKVIRELIAAGKTWKSHAEDLPAIGYTGGDSGNYAVRHNPIAYMTDVQNDPAQTKNLVPSTRQFGAPRSRRTACSSLSLTKRTLWISQPAAATWPPLLSVRWRSVATSPSLSINIKAFFA